MIKNLFKKKLKCPICNEKAEDLSAEMRLDTSEGVHVINICPDCADFFDKSAEVLIRKKSSDDEQSV